MVKLRAPVTATLPVAFAWLLLAGCGRTDLDFSGENGGHSDAASSDASASGGRGNSGGISGSGGGSGTGGRAGTGGRPATGGISGTGGRSATGGRTGTGGVVGTGGRGMVPDGGGPDAAVDRPSPDAGPDLPPSTPGTLLCGAQTCDTRTQSCCVSITAGSAGARCVPAGTACSGVGLVCDEPGDCATGTCCVGLQLGGAGVSVGSQCVVRAACVGVGRFVVCRTNSDCAAPTPVCCQALGVPICQATCGGS